MALQRTISLRWVLAKGVGSGHSSAVLPPRPPDRPDCCRRRHGRRAAPGRDCGAGKITAGPCPGEERSGIGSAMLAAAIHRMFEGPCPSGVRSGPATHRRSWGAAAACRLLASGEGVGYPQGGNFASPTGPTGWCEASFPAVVRSIRLPPAALPACERRQDPALATWSLPYRCRLRRVISDPLLRNRSDGERSEVARTIARVACLAP